MKLMFELPVVVLKKNKSHSFNMDHDKHTKWIAMVNLNFDITAFAQNRCRIPGADIFILYKYGIHKI